MSVKFVACSLGLLLAVTLVLWAANSKMSSAPVIHSYATSGLQLAPDQGADDDDITVSLGLDLGRLA